MNAIVKRRFRWWYIPVGLLVLILVLIIVLVCFMRSMLPFQNVVAATSNVKLELSEGMQKFALSGERDYSTLPDALTMQDGTAVTTPEQFDERRAEILQLFEEYVYGALPKEGFETSFEIVEEGEAVGFNAIRRQVKITVTTDKGSSDALLLLYIPKNVDGPVPVVLGLNSNGNHAALSDPAILPPYTFDTTAEGWEEKRGEKDYRWNIGNSIARGYAVATVYCNDFAEDNSKTYADRVISLFDEEDFKAVGAWAFGLQRCVDYLLTDEAIDASRIALIGHSRLGKAAVWAGANDDRVALVISNDSGNSGASLSRGNHGETVKSINLAFPHWFSENYKAYGNKESDLPVDQNLLLAAIAPRKLYVASAAGDLWADPQGAWNSLMAASKAFALYGLDVIPYSESQPAVDTTIQTEAMGYHVRSGWHDIQAEDWAYYLTFMDTYLPGE